MSKKAFKQPKNSRAINQWRKNQHAAWAMEWEPKAKGDAGYVYVFRLSMDGNYKIGMSKNWQRRLKETQTQAPHSVCVFSAFVSDMRATEKDLHALYKSKRVGGEVYRLDPDDIFLINQHISKLKSKGVIA